VSFGSSPDRIDSLAQVALGVLRTFAAEGPTAAELATVREALLRNHETALRENEYWAGLLQNEALWGDDAAESVSTYPARVRALDAESLRAVAKVVLDETNFARFTLLPAR
jgi:zinc protease